MTDRARIALGMAAGLLWAVGLLWGAARYVQLPVFTLVPTIMTAFLAPGLVMAAMVARLAQRRFFDEGIIGGGAFAPGSAADIDQRVLRNTAEQLVLALCIWPAAAVLLAGQGPGVIVSLGIGFAIARLAFWAGYHIAPPLRAFGFAATFYPTVLVALWALVRLAGMAG
ncbi:MAPEG family protein [Roseovarius spongiae]|uniref:MAPEG family protein n=1 Tax=Roseovarius spongiae TaxID=2320272 RepID=A0A3A8AW80_9RHOB|nr:MAPEG family protein [Roseovarius spongiae]RKF14920.1 MAPEG family protein [Roseovarius spongiae]